MDRQDFLDGLYEALAGEVSEDKRQSDIRYYRDYISEEMSRGRTEEDVLAELGDPRLIARSIVDAQVASEEKRGYSYSDGNAAAYAFREAAEEGAEYDAYGSADYGYESRPEDPRGYEEQQINGKVVTFSGLKARLIIAAVIVGILVLLSLVFSVVLRILFSPVFWIILAGYIIVRTFTDRSGL